MVVNKGIIQRHRNGPASVRGNLEKWAKTCAEQPFKVG
jgi:hypothetical protein